MTESSPGPRLPDALALEARPATLGSGHCARPHGQGLRGERGRFEVGVHPLGVVQQCQGVPFGGAGGAAVVRERLEQLPVRRQQSRGGARGGVVAEVAVVGGIEHGDLAEGGGGGVAARDAGGHPVGGEFLSAARAPGGAQTERAVGDEGSGHQAVAEPDAAGVHFLGLAALAQGR
ncbi:hypothetical protein [Streptomyces olivoreticuli]|uniref:hypothetical protein n=1 Tax=Streptomyces olivoreticuli TaxID=68246 RepID=UPI0013C2F7EB|nr:hypothetical protein [Streptomyces olivoreticuli]